MVLLPIKALESLFSYTNCHCIACSCAHVTGCKGYTERYTTLQIHRPASSRISNSRGNIAPLEYTGDSYFVWTRAKGCEKWLEWKCKRAPSNMENCDYHSKC